MLNFCLKRAFKHGFCSRLYTIDAIAEDADIGLFCKITKTQHGHHSLLPPVKSCTHSNTLPQTQRAHIWTT